MNSTLRVEQEGRWNVTDLYSEIFKIHCSEWGKASSRTIYIARLPFEKEEKLMGVYLRLKGQGDQRQRWKLDFSVFPFCHFHFLNYLFKLYS